MFSKNSHALNLAILLLGNYLKEMIMEIHEDLSMKNVHLEYWNIGILWVGNDISTYRNTKQWVKMIL